MGSLLVGQKEGFCMKREGPLPEWQAPPSQGREERGASARRGEGEKGFPDVVGRKGKTIITPRKGKNYITQSTLL